MTRLAALLVLVVLVASPAAALAAQPRTSFADVESDVMCVECGTPLEVSQSPVADQERAVIRRLIAAGDTKRQIEDALVAQYGRAVLADPSDGGIGIAAWWVPVVIVPLAAVGAGLLARRWRRRAAAAPSAAGGAALAPEDERRLDAELAAFDR